MKQQRITSIDLLRGAIMLIMALDHTRDYFHADAFHFDPLDLEKTTIVLYFTRWITHFCAPIFILLSGTSAFLSGQRKTRKQLSVFLLKRGLWLIFLELLVVNFAWFFNPSFPVILLGVIWIIGVAMIFLAGFIFLPGKLLLIISLLMIFGHNLLDATHFESHDGIGFLWGILHDRKIFQLGHFTFLEAYQVIPWVGVMALGYCLGPLFTSAYDPSARRKLLIIIGIASLLLFVLLRSINIYGDLWPREHEPTLLLGFLSFLNISKYPPSLDYLLVTDGAALLFLGLTENLSNRFTQIISIFGRVPMFYYLLHIYLIHLGAILLAVATGHPWTVMVNLNNWVTAMPTLQNYGVSLGYVYIIWISVIVLLYPLCKKYDRYKFAHKGMWWLSYL